MVVLGSVPESGIFLFQIQGLVRIQNSSWSVKISGFNMAACVYGALIISDSCLINQCCSDFSLNVFKKHHLAQEELLDAHLKLHNLYEHFYGSFLCIDLNEGKGDIFLDQKKKKNIDRKAKSTCFEIEFVAELVSYYQA